MPSLIQLKLSACMHACQQRTAVATAHQWQASDGDACHCCLACGQFFQDTEVELRQPRPNGFPASGIWGYRVSNVALNLLNYYWFAKIAAKALQMVAPRRKAKSRAGKIC